MITSIDGNENPSMEDVAALVNESDVGDTVELTIEREGQTKTVEVTLGERPTETTSDSGTEQPSEPVLPPGFGQ